ncbi:DUF3987 domain-containing protein [Halospina sp. K52047b]|uniref:DUF3987 domain-containing protein n=1 Tax=Halospina sp. K52047b TaxID=2614160 RepID=UPI001CE49062|nr:DUF3987 domain-containing protein [Halospina sp. K52047b]
MRPVNESAATAGKAGSGAKESGQAQQQYNPTAQEVTSGTPVFPLYTSVKAKAPERLISLDELAVMMMSPSEGPKDQANAFTPFQAKGKTKDHALKADFYALALDHDDDDRDRDSLAGLYEPWGMAWDAFTSASHQQDKHGVTANRWKVTVPFSRPVGYERYMMLAEGASLLVGTDKVQARAQQVIYAPNVLTNNAPYDFIPHEPEVPFLDPLDDSHPFIAACLEAYQKEQERQDAEARKAPPKPRPQVSEADGRIIDKVVNSHLLEGELQVRGYQEVGKRLLSPYSSTGSPGVNILTSEDGKERAYSHHGASDPLSNLNNDGHALDVFDVICILDYGGDVSKAVADLADRVDPEGQKERQREWAQKNAKVEAESLLSDSANCPPPADLFGKFTTPAFPVELMPAPIRDYAEDQAELIGVDPAIISMAALGAVAGCLDDRVEIQPKRYDPTWTESARLWIGIIGDPSAKKSPGIKKALSPVRKIAAEWREEYAKKMKAWEEACKQKEKGEEDPPAPELRRLTTSDVTVEKLGDILAKCEPRGIIVDKDELTGWLASMDAYKGGSGGKDKAAWLEAYNGGGLEIDRIGRGSTWVANWSACVIGGIQPQVINEYANANNHDGMLQRFMLIHAASAQQGVDRRPNMEAKESYEALLRQLVGTQAGNEPVTLSPEAHEVREAFNDRLHRAVTTMPNRHLTAMLGKWEGLFSRVCLAFHAAECAHWMEHPTAHQVSRETAQKVDRFLWNAMLPHAIQFYDGMDPTEDQARQLAGLVLARQWGRFTVKRDLHNYMLAYRKMKEWEREEMLDRLEAYNWIGPEPGCRLNERGRPSAYLVNPQIHTMYQDHAEQERERRQEVARIMADLKESG